MTDKVQKIREEVKRLMYGFNLEADIASCEDDETEKLADIKYQLCKKILDYIDDTQKEPVRDDLEEAAIAYNKKVNFIVAGNIPNEHFVAGAKWQQEKMMKNAIKTEVCERITQNGLLPSVTVLVNDCKPNEKVKVIVIKED